MGGGHHGHHAMKIPDYKIYKVEDVPELMAVRRVLATQGLKDPWLRNEVWKYNLKQRGTFWQIMRKVFGRGIGIGFVAGAITAGAETYWKSKQHHGHGHDHDDHEDHHAPAH